MLIGLAEAQRRIIAACSPLGMESVPLGAALGRVLGVAAHAREDLVPFARSAMDGFSVRACDTVAAPVSLDVSGNIYAEGAALRMQPSLTACAIATGAPLPLGADAVVPIEDVVVEGERVRLTRAVVAGAHVFPPGDDALRGDLLVAAGTVLGPGALGLLASAGHAQIDVVRRPRVAIVCGGEELVGVDETPGFGQIRNSNATLVAASMALMGAEVVSNVLARDDAPALRAELQNAFAAADLVITTGGASVGERDYVKPLLRELGVAFQFESVALRPARPTAFGSYRNTQVAVLAGNPAAVFVALHELVRPALYRLAGRSTQLIMVRVRARLAGELHGKANRTYLPFVRVGVGSNGLVAIPLDNQCSALTRTASDANGFAVIGPETGDVADGETVDVDIYDWAAVREVGDARDHEPAVASDERTMTATAAGTEATVGARQ
jgi:molybdopterin molybdotransferase